MPKKVARQSDILFGTAEKTIPTAAFKILTAD